MRALAAEAPGLSVEVLPRLADAGRALSSGSVDLVIEPPEIMGRHRPADDPAVGRPLDVLRVGRQPTGRQADDARRLHLARAPDLLDGRRRPAGRASRPRAEPPAASTVASSSASRASCSRRSCCRRPTSSPSCPPAPRRSCAAPARSACSSRRSRSPSSSRCSGGTRAPTPTRHTPGCARASASSPTASNEQPAEHITRCDRSAEDATAPAATTPHAGRNPRFTIRRRAHVHRGGPRHLVST